MSVKISDFVKEALLEITRGVVDAANEAPVTIAPSSIEGKNIFTANEVHFELFVEASEGNKVTGAAEGGGTLLSIVKASAKLNGEKSSTATSSQKITFSVPVYFNSFNVRKK